MQPGETVQITGTWTRIGQDLWMVTALKNKCWELSWRSRAMRGWWWIPTIMLKGSWEFSRLSMTPTTDSWVMILMTMLTRRKIITKAMTQTKIIQLYKYLHHHHWVIWLDIYNNSLLWKIVEIRNQQPWMLIGTTKYGADCLSDVGISTWKAATHVFLGGLSIT